MTESLWVKLASRDISKVTHHIVSEKHYLIAPKYEIHKGTLHLEINYMFLKVSYILHSMCLSSIFTSKANNTE